MTGELQQSLDQAKRELDAATVTEEQLDMLEPISAEEMVEARADLGENAGRLTLLRHAREKRRGRPKGARNKRTDDLAKYLLQFGEDPLVAAMKLATTQPELLVEASTREFVDIRTVGTGEKAHVVTTRYQAPSMGYGDAQALIMRARELIAPYIHGKKPVAIVHDFSGIKDLVIEGLTHSREEVQDIVDADFLEIEDQREGRDE